jgi:branched-chain amino acid transport system permease protein
MTAARTAISAVQGMATRRGWIFTTLLLPLLVLVAPFAGLGLTGQRNIELILLLGLVVSGLNLCYGYAGELALGQIAVYAAGAYVAGYVSIHFSSDVLLCVALAALVGPIIGLISGIPGLRLGGWSLAMVSFFLVLMIPDFVSILGKYTGGSAGLNGIGHPTIFGQVLNRTGFYVFIVVISAGWFALLRNCVLSRLGLSLLVLRESPVLAASVGLSVFRSKLTAYMIGAIPAGIAGALLAYMDRFLIPDEFDFSLAIAVLAATVLGGKTSVYGALIGSAVLELGPLRAGAFQNYAFVIYGAFLLIGGIVLPGGVIGVVKLIVRKLAPPRREPVSDGDGPDPDLALAGKVLRVEDVRKSFGGAVALDGVTLQALPGRVTSIIGPNGSGKTTLLNLINGYSRADSGAVTLDGQSTQTMRAYQVARLGVARTFQTPIVSQDISVLETAVSGRVGLRRVGLLSAIFRLPKYRRTARADDEIARRALNRVGLAHLTFEPGSSLPLGSRRLLELARVLAAEPSVILLDEVASGVDEEAVAQLAVLIRGLAKAGATVILVEHNFRLVLEISDEIFVLANGSIVASGTPDEIATHPAVIEKYLGTRTVFGEAAK